MNNDRFNTIRSMKNTSEIVKLRRMVERIEKKLNLALKVLDANSGRKVFEDNETFKK
jgi:hypothetical protein